MIFKVVLLVSCFSSLVHSAAINENGSKIVGGTPATMGQFPYQVSIQLKPDRVHFCGGSIIDEKYILTAAHCFYGLAITAENIEVWAGGIALAEVGTTGQIVDVDQIILAKYDPKTKDNDIAVLQLKDPLIFSDNINKIDVATESTPAGEVCTVSGWGYTSEGASEASPDLLYVDINIVDHDTCQQAYDTLNFKLTDNQICAGSNTIPKDACKGDSGGPLVRDGKQIGIVSFGAGCGRTKYPGVYTDVTKYKIFGDMIRV